MNPTAYEHIQAAALAIASRISPFPKIAIVLGSGLGEFTNEIRDQTMIPYAEIPHFPTTTVTGHQGNLVVGKVENQPIAALQGRFHFYEGHDLAAVTFPIRVLRAAGVETLILTAATGAIHPSYRAGDLMLLSDHLNLVGTNPLRGPNDDRHGPRFPDMSEVYSKRLRTIAQEEAVKLRCLLHTGVYACLSGPSYETPAEIRMLRTLGADVVGMSTVPEAIVARHAGMEVLAFALATNAAAGTTDEPISHNEVLAAGREAGPRLNQLVTAILARLDATTKPSSEQNPGF